MFWHKYALTLHRKYCIKHTYANEIVVYWKKTQIWSSCILSGLTLKFHVALPCLVFSSLSLLLTQCCCSVTQSCPTLCYPMDCNTPGLPVLYCIPELAQTQVHWISDFNQPSHPLFSPSPPAFNLPQHQGLFQWVGSSYQVTQVLQLQYQSFQWVFRVHFL